MSTVLITHSACLGHDTGDYHPECAERLAVLLRAFESEDFWMLHRMEAPVATREQILRAHTAAHFDAVRASQPTAGNHHYLDPDTVMSAGSWPAALHAAGAVIAAVDGVMKGEFRHAFCAVRPPGHHATANGAMGFCLFNNIAIGAMQARAVHGARRVAVIDLDVHHGNGTQDIFYDDEGLFYASTHQRGAYPNTGFVEETGRSNNIVNVPLPAGAGSEEWRAAVLTQIVPRLEAFDPELLMLSMGFDAHRDDPLAQMRLTADDFGWVTELFCTLAAKHCENRLVSALEGGYDLRALTYSAVAHLRALMGF